jgi:hypothetical protein
LLEIISLLDYFMCIHETTSLSSCFKTITMPFLLARAPQRLQLLLYQNASIIFANPTVASVSTSPRFRNAAFLSEYSRKDPNAKLRVKSKEPNRGSLVSATESKETYERMISIMDKSRSQPPDEEEDESEGVPGEDDEDEEEYYDLEEDIHMAVEREIEDWTVEERENVAWEVNNAKAEGLAWTEG